jgi:polygalacturonase
VSKLLLIACALSVIGPVRSQDRRTVKEPRFPESCAVLKAGLRVSADGLSTEEESAPDTKRIQKALDECTPGRAVLLQADGSNRGFLSGPLELRRDVTLRVGQGAILFASRDPHDYDISAGSCGIVNETGHGCKPLIAANAISGAGVMGPGTIDGRGGSRLLHQAVSWWDLAQEAKVRNANQNVPRIMQLNHADDFTLYRIALRNSPNFHVSYSGGHGFIAWGVIIDSPKTSRNTDGIDPSSATDVTITQSYIRAGDDSIAIKAGSTGPSAYITISHNHFYNGHGMSIGSETDGGAHAIRVTDLTIDGADNGIRIKSNSSRGGLVEDVQYTDVCIRNTKNPLMFDSNYSFYGTARGKLPVFRGITLTNIGILGPGKITFDGLDPEHRLGIVLDNVWADKPDRLSVVSHHGELHLKGSTNLNPAGDDVTIDRTNSGGAPPVCAAQFVPFPNGVNP